jgi:hypothetical protein
MEPPMMNLSAADIRERPLPSFTELAKAVMTKEAEDGFTWESLTGDELNLWLRLVREILARAATGFEPIREEVAFWRRDLSARLWSDAACLKFEISAGNEVPIAALSCRLHSALASHDAAEHKDWHSRCGVCGEFVLPGEPTAAGDDISGHARCLMEDQQDAVRGEDTSEADLQAHVAEARKTLAQLDREPPPPLLIVTCPTCAGTGSMTPGRGHDNNKDTCTTCGGEGTIPAATGTSPETSYNAETLHVPV